MFRSDVTVMVDGSLRVTERITVRAQGHEIKRGIYRDFPTRYEDRLGRRYTVGFRVVEVLRDGAPEPYFTEDRANGVRVYVGRKDVFLPPGEYTYSLTYVTTHQLGFFDDHDELYWNVTGNGWNFPIERAEAEIRLPDTVPDIDVNLGAYTGPSGATGASYEAEVAGAGRGANQMSLFAKDSDRVRDQPG